MSNPKIESKLQDLVISLEKLRFIDKVTYKYINPNQVKLIIKRNSNSFYFDPELILSEIIGCEHEIKYSCNTDDFKIIEWIDNFLPIE